jgi:hypothetical protein
MEMVFYMKANKKWALRMEIEVARTTLLNGKECKLFKRSEVIAQGLLRFSGFNGFAVGESYFNVDPDSFISGKFCIIKVTDSEREDAEKDKEDTEKDEEDTEKDEEDTEKDEENAEEDEEDAEEEYVLI